MLANISKSKGSHNNDIGQLIEYNVGNIFLEKLYSGGETISKPFSKKSKLSISLDQFSKVLYSWFLLYAKLRSIEIY